MKRAKGRGSTGRKSGLSFVATAGLAVCSAALSGGAILTLSGGGDILRLSQAEEERANAALAGVQPDLDLARRSTFASLSQAPANASAWARLAYIDRLAAGRLTPQAWIYLAKSYEVAPLGPDISDWRLRFLYEHWDQLNPELRVRATMELRTLARYRWRVAQAAVTDVQNPTGRFAAGLALDLGRTDGSRDREARQAMQN